MMKRMSIIILLILGLFLTACSSNDDGDKKEEPNNEQGASTSNKEKSDDKNDSKEGNIYQIGETAQTKTINGYPYEITLNSFDITTKDPEGVSIDDYNYESEDGGRFAILNVTMKNIGEKSFIPNSQISANIVYSSGGYEHDRDEEFFVERKDELAPGEEITGDLVFTSMNFLDDEKLHLIYEYLATDEEIRFELPVSEN